MRKLVTSFILTLTFGLGWPALGQAAETPSAPITANQSVVTSTTPNDTNGTSTASVATPNASSGSVQPVTVVGRVVWIKGELKAVGQDNKERILKRTSPIYLHDTLITSKASQAQVVFSDNGLMAFQPDTTFKIDKFEFDPKNPEGKDGKAVLNIVKGGMRAVTGWVGKSNPENYEVSTPVATIGIRGTDFALFYSEKDKLQAMLNVGKINIRNSGGVTELDEATKKLYAKVDSLQQRPEITDKASEVFKGLPKMLPATMPGTPGVPGMKEALDKGNKAAAKSEKESSGKGSDKSDGAGGAGDEGGVTSGSGKSGTGGGGSGGGASGGIGGGANGGSSGGSRVVNSFCIS